MSSTTGIAHRAVSSGNTRMSVPGAERQRVPGPALERREPGVPTCQVTHLHLGRGPGRRSQEAMSGTRPGRRAASSVTLSDQKSPRVRSRRLLTLWGFRRTCNKQPALSQCSMARFSSDLDRMGVDVCLAPLPGHRMVSVSRMITQYVQSTYSRGGPQAGKLSLHRRQVTSSHPSMCLRTW